MLLFFTGLYGHSWLYHTVYAASALGTLIKFCISCSCQHNTRIGWQFSPSGRTCVSPFFWFFFWSVAIIELFLVQTILVIWFEEVTISILTPSSIVAGWCAVNPGNCRYQTPYCQQWLSRSSAVSKPAKMLALVECHFALNVFLILIRQSKQTHAYSHSTQELNQPKCFEGFFLQLLKLIFFLSNFKTFFNALLIFKQLLLF